MSSRTPAFLRVKRHPVMVSFTCFTVLLAVLYFTEILSGASSIAWLSAFVLVLVCLWLLRVYLSHAKERAVKQAISSLVEQGIRAALGVDGEKDSDKAEEYFQQAAAIARRGDEKKTILASAYEIVALSFAKGDGVAQDEKEADHWLHQMLTQFNQHMARKSEFTGAWYQSVGKDFAMGMGVEASESEAERWFRKAGEMTMRRSMEHSCYEVGEDYALGRSGVKDRERAEQWFRKAANAGESYPLEKSFLNMGWKYALGDRGDIIHGRPVSADEEEAEYWFRKAADAGGTPLKQIFTEVAHYHASEHPTRGKREDIARRWRDKCRSL